MTQSRHILGQALMGLVCCLIGLETAPAASLSLVPVRVSLTAKQPISAINVRNDGDEATVVQLEVANWSQAEGKDVYTPTTEVLATPPIFTVPPGGSQLVRVGLRRAADTSRELAYRLFLQEVPPPPAPDFKGLHVALRFGVPVFVAPLTAPAKVAVGPTQALQWHARAAPGQMTLTATNTGAVHVQVTQFTLTHVGDSTPLIQRKEPGYVFPGQHRDWQLELKAPPAAGASLHLTAESDVGPMQADVVVETP